MKSNMITKIEVRNLKSLGHLELGLSPLTFIGGRNGTGKTTILDALECAVAGKHRTIGSKGPAIGRMIKHGQSEGLSRVTFNDGKAREFNVKRAKGKRGTVSVKVNGDESPIEALLLDPSPVMALSANATTSWLLRHSGERLGDLSESIDRVSALIKEQSFTEAGMRFRDGFISDRAAEIDAMPDGDDLLSRWLSQGLEEARKIKLDLAGTVRRLQGATEEAADPPTRVEDPASEIDRLGQSVAAVEGEIKRLEGERSRWHRIGIILKDFPENPKNKIASTTSEIERLEAEHARLVSDYNDIAQRREALYGSMRPASDREAIIDFLCEQRELHGGDAVPIFDAMISNVKQPAEQAREAEARYDEQLVKNREDRQEISGAIGRLQGEREYMIQAQGIWNEFVIKEGAEGNVTLEDARREYKVANDAHVEASRKREGLVSVARIWRRSGMPSRPTRNSSGSATSKRRHSRRRSRRKRLTRRSRRRSSWRRLSSLRRCPRRCARRRT